MLLVRVKVNETLAAKAEDEIKKKIPMINRAIFFMAVRLSLSSGPFDFAPSPYNEFAFFIFARILIP